MGWSWVVSSASSSSDPGKYLENDKELFMNNQNSGNGGASPKVQAMVDPASKDTSGQGPAADSLTGTSTPADTAGQSAAPGTIVPDSEKGGHV
jgi:hypothetical protein